MSTDPKTELAEAIAEADAEAERLRARHAAIEDAEHRTRRATQLNIYRDADGQTAADHNHARREAQERLEAIADAETLDFSALLVAFTEMKACDARCGALGRFAGRLNDLDPVPPLPNNGAPRVRPPRAFEVFADTTWSQYLDGVIRRHTEREGSRHLQKLGDAAHEKITAAVNDARNKAAALDDGEQLDVDTPPTIAELHQAAIDTIDESTFEEDQVRSAGINTVRNIAANAELEKLIQAGQ